MEVNKTPEELQQALLAEQGKSKQLEIDLGTEREARGKAEQALLAANLLNQQLSTDLGTERAALGSERAAHTKTTAALADANALVDQLNEAVGEQPETAKAPTATLGSGKDAKTYRFTVPQFNLPGIGIVVAAEVKNNSDVLMKLVESGAKVIELVPAK